MNQKEETFTFQERHAIAVKAVNRLIADAEAKRLRENKELAEVIAVCIRETTSSQLRTLNWNGQTWSPESISTSSSNLGIIL